jgi:hypothetical protein
MKKTAISILVFAALYLPALVLAQSPGGMSEKMQQISKEMMKVILARSENYKSLKGKFYMTDANGNDYYFAKNIDLFADKKYVEIKKNGQVGFIANWPVHKNEDVGSTLAMAAFTHELVQLPEAKGYTTEDGGLDSLTHNTMYYLKAPGDNGKRVAMFIFNLMYRESTFIVDNNL